MSSLGDGAGSRREPAAAATGHTAAATRPADTGAEAAHDAFRSFHRRRVRAALRVRLPLGILAITLLAAVVWGGVAASTTTGVDAAAPTGTAVDGSGDGGGGAKLAGGMDAGALDTGAADAGAAASADPGSGAQAPVAPGAPDAQAGVPIAAPAAVPAQEPQPQGQTPVAPTPLYSIAVTARGYQAELDACQWVRMDVGAVAPIVGAHNFCHGDIVLAMKKGEIVTVTGTELDGDYQITGSRDARAGDDASRATAGLTGDIIFQTCYWEDARGLRLVTAVRVDLSLPPIVVG